MRSRRPRAVSSLAAAAMLALAAAPPPAPLPALRAPAYTREDMESALVEGERWRFIYGTRDPAATAALKSRARVLAGRFGGDTTAVIGDRAA
jgi:hypothetical protein